MGQRELGMCLGSLRQSLHQNRGGGESLVEDLLDGPWQIGVQPQQLGRVDGRLAGR